MLRVPQARRRLVARGARTAAGALVLVLALTGCGGGTGGGTGQPATMPTAPQAPMTTTAEGVGNVVTVEMTDFALALSQSAFTPDTYTFRASNEGQAPHTISINGPGVEDQTAGGPAQPGQEVELTVTLQSGTYEIWCPVGNHQALGMTSTFTVN
jgi:plastocyanin